MAGGKIVGHGVDVTLVVVRVIVLLTVAVEVIVLLTVAVEVTVLLTVAVEVTGGLVDVTVLVIVTGGLLVVTVDVTAGLVAVTTLVEVTAGGVTVLVVVTRKSHTPSISMNSTKVQNPRRNSYAGLTFNSSTSVVCIYCACVCECLAAPSRPACFTPVAPVASL